MILLLGQFATFSDWHFLFKSISCSRDLCRLGRDLLRCKIFFIIKRYNASDFYALAVSLLADRLAGKPGMVQLWPRPSEALFVEEKFELQELLQATGCYDGAIDGDLGRGTRKGIKAFQSSSGMAAPDGKPTRAVLEALRKARKEGKKHRDKPSEVPQNPL
ncbi:MAG: hypothetical protein D3910_20205 [Candidatus Electrothrix sp. ATG2]|nr:hypothetical protein [Candidatus Electrothrix sp. ATG2]